MTDYSEDRVISLLNADLADTLGNLLQRVTGKKLNPAMDEEEERPQSSRLTSEWSEMTKDREDGALVDYLNHLTGVLCNDCEIQDSVY